MTKQEMLEMAKKLQAQADAMPDDSGENPASTTTESGGEDVEKKPATDSKDGTAKDSEMAETQEETSDGEVEEQKQIEPQTNGKITDDVTPKVDTQFENPAPMEEPNGVEQVLHANFDQRFATFTKELAILKSEMDKMKVVLSEIMTRIELVQEVTDKVTTVDHESLLTESIKLLV